MRPWEIWLAFAMLFVAGVLIGLTINVALRCYRASVAPYSAPIHDPRD